MKKWSIRSRRPRTTLFPETSYIQRDSRHKYDAGDECLQDLEETRNGGEKATGFTRSFVDQPDLGGVQAKTQTGNRRCPDLPGAGGACEERGVDYCNGEHHKCGQHSKSHGEVFPWNRHFGVQVGKLQTMIMRVVKQQEAPAEHAPKPIGTWLHSGMPADAANAKQMHVRTTSTIRTMPVGRVSDLKSTCNMTKLFQESQSLFIVLDFQCFWSLGNCATFFQASLCGFTVP